MTDDDDGEAPVATRDVAPDWDPHGPDVLADQRAAYDSARARCPVAHDAGGGWTVFRHADVMRVLADPTRFSNVVSRHVSVPNGMDPPEHTAYRQLILPCFSPDRVAALEPALRRIAVDLIDQVCERPEADWICALALPYAARAQCAWLGWPVEQAEALVAWTRRNQDASLAGDRQALADVARELDQMVAALMAARSAAGRHDPGDITDLLLRQTIDGRPLTNAELTSIFRNWTMGEVGTIAAAIGILATAMADDTELQYQLRRHLQLLPAAIDELLRLHGPLVSNRRTVTGPTTLGGRALEAGDRVTINWMAANRDPGAFHHADRFRTDRAPWRNLLYGAGIHACPGAGLATLELRVLMEELLAGTVLIEHLPTRSAVPAPPPASGYRTLRLHVVR